MWLSILRLEIVCSVDGTTETTPILDSDERAVYQEALQVQCDM
jgi:hypothetical protein